jgi:hypothetical protein
MMHAMYWSGATGISDDTQEPILYEGNVSRRLLIVSILA